MKKLAFTTALLAAGVAAQTAHAATYTGYGYYQNNPAKSSFTLTLSGACSGVIELPVTSVGYYRYLYHDGAAIDRTEDNYGYYYVNTSDNDINSYGYNYYYTAGEKISESVKKGTRTLSMKGGKNASYTYIYPLSGGAYDSQITCKDGKTLSENLYGWNAYFNYAASKTSVSVTHTNSTDAPGTGNYKFKLTTSSLIEMPGKCSVKKGAGPLFSEDYSLVCAPANTIKIKLLATAEGTSLLD